MCGVGSESDVVARCFSVICDLSDASVISVAWLLRDI